MKPNKPGMITGSLALTGAMWLLLLAPGEYTDTEANAFTPYPDSVVLEWVMAHTTGIDTEVRVKGTDTPESQGIELFFKPRGLCPAALLHIGPCGQGEGACLQWEEQFSPLPVLSWLQRQGVPGFSWQKEWVEIKNHLNEQVIDENGFFFTFDH